MERDEAGHIVLPDDVPKLKLILDGVRSGRHCRCYHPEGMEYISLYHTPDETGFWSIWTVSVDECWIDGVFDDPVKAIAAAAAY